MRSTVKDRPRGYGEPNASVSGRVDPAGNILDGVGFTVTRSALGVFDIVILEPFLEVYSVTATVDSPTGNPPYIATATWTDAQRRFTVKLYTSANALADNSFTINVKGRR